MSQYRAPLADMVLLGVETLFLAVFVLGAQKLHGS